MRALIVSDIHANLDAWWAVIEHASGGDGFEQIWCLGDIVGYGPDPNEIVAQLQERAARCVAGNHDLAAVGEMGVEDFNPVAADAATWTRDRLGAAERDYLRALPQTRIEGAFTLAHGSLRAPAWEYLMEAEQAEAQFALQTTPYSLVGHTHVPCIFTEREERASRPLLQRDGSIIELAQDRRILNPGSVGQPRDGDPRAAYILYDAAAASATFHRVAYDIVAVQKRIRATGLSDWLAERLATGR